MYASSTHVRSVQFSSVAQSCPTLRPHQLQHTRPPCLSPTPRVHSDSRPSSQWCHPAISSSVVPFSPCPQSLPASESFPMSQLFAWGGQSTKYLLWLNKSSQRNNSHYIQRNNNKDDNQLIIRNNEYQWQWKSIFKGLKRTMSPQDSPKLLSKKMKFR